MTLGQMFQLITIDNNTASLQLRYTPGKQFDKLLNVTLCYPDNNRQPFFDMLSGKLTRIVVHVDLQPIADELHGDYINDKSFKRHFQQWLNSLWQEKDRLLTSLMSSQRQDK